MNELSLDKINPELLDPQIWDSVIKQIQKDFDEHQIVWEKPKGKTLYISVFDSLKEFIQDLTRTNFDLYQLMYRIDIPEKYYHRLRLISDLNDFVDQLTGLILKREIQKVLIRKHFSENGV